MSADQQPFHPLFQKLARQLVKVSSKPLPKNVHQFRTATRRVEACLQELGPEPNRNQRKLRRQLSRLRRRAGRLRDIDVQVAALRTFKVPEEPARKTHILNVLSETRAKRELKLVKAFHKKSVSEIRKRLKRAESDLAAVTKQFDSLSCARRLLTDLLREPGPLDEDLLHQYRIKGKRIRYIAELAGDVPEATRMVAQLKRMQDALGDWHDWLTLTATVRHLISGTSSSPLLSALNNITRAKYRDAVRLVEETRATFSKPAAAPKRRAPQAVARPAAAAVA